MEYYRISNVDYGENSFISPTGFYEAVGEDGDIIVRWVCDLPLFFKSDIKETCFAREPYLCLLSMTKSLKEGIYYLYQTSDVPDIDLSHSVWNDTIDCAFVGEVRFQKDVNVKRIKTLYFT